MEFSSAIPLKAIRLIDLPYMIGLSRRAIFYLMKEPDFPKPIKLTKRAIGFYEHEIQEWLRNRPRV